MLVPQVQTLLKTEVDRQKFLAILGSLLLGVVGVSRLLATLEQTAGNHSARKASGYGGSSYGG